MLDGGVAVAPARAGLRARAYSLMAAVALAAAAAFALGRLPLNLYDVSFSLDWGQDLLHGRLPDVQVAGASTPHPLSILSGAVASLFGAGGLDAMRVVVLLAGGVAGVALYRIGREAMGGRRWGGVAVGVIAVLTLALSEQFLVATLGQATPSDLPSLAAVLAALALEVARPRRGVAPLALLGIAGLWRPEPWLLSIAYWLYLAPRLDRGARLRLGALALAAPTVWMGTDRLLTGDALYSLAHTHAGTVLAQRPTGITNVPDSLWATLGNYLGTPALIGALAGLLLDLRLRRLPRQLRVAVVLTVAGFAVVGAAHMPLDDRYLLPTTALLSVYIGFFLVAWTSVARGWVRHAWMAGAAIVAVTMVTLVPGRVQALGRDHGSFSAETRAIAQLQSLVRPAPVRDLLVSCGPIAASYRILPVLAYDLDRPPRTLLSVDHGIMGASLVLPSSRLAAQLFETHNYPTASLTSRGYMLVVSNADWAVWTLCD